MSARDPMDNPPALSIDPPEQPIQQTFLLSLREIPFPLFDKLGARKLPLHFEYYPVSAFALRQVHQFVRRFDELFVLYTVGIFHDTCTNADFAAEFLADGLAQSFDQRRSLFQTGVRQKKDEFIPPITESRINSGTNGF